MSSLKDLWVFALLGVLLTVIPYAAGAGVAVCLFFHFWSNISVWWTAIPAGIFLMWFIWATRGD